MKTKFSIFNFQFGVLLLTCLDLPAQAPPPTVPVIPAGPAAASTDTNRLEALRKALRRAMVTNPPPVEIGAPKVTTPAPATVAAPVPPVLPRALTAPGTNVAVVPGAVAKPATPPATVPPPAPVPGTPLPLPEAATTNQTVAIPPPPGTTNMAPEELLPTGFFDFRGVDINAVLLLYAELVNRTVLRPAGLSAPPIVLKTQTPLTKREAIQALDSVLGMNGITMINFGEKFVKAEVVASANTVGAPISTAGATNLPDFGSYLTHVVQLHYVKPSEMVQVLQPFAKIPTAILPIDASQILVLRDFTENVKRMLEMIEKIDVAIPSEFVSEVIPIKYAKATEIAQALNSLSTGGGATTFGAGGGGAGGTRTTGRSTGFGRTGQAGQAGYPGAFPGQVNPAVPQAQPGAQPGATGSFSDRLRSILKGSSATGEIVVLGQTKMIADERSNSLLIYSSRDDMKIIKDIISKLDVVLAQVLIEAVIIEVNMGDSRDLGISYIQQQPRGVGSYFRGLGAINNGTSFTQSPLVSGATNIAGGALPGGFSFLGSFGQDLDVTLTAVANDSRAKILQRPRIQTSHNEPASIFVGESRPYPQGSYYGGGSFGGYSQIQQLQIGVSLDVTPLINPDGLVVMEIHQKIESANGSVNLPNVGEVPITSQKEASAKVSVRDRDTIILGGLVETSKSKSASGVPYLKDIPLLGYLFRSTNNKEQRNELLVLIRPTVLPTPEVAALTARTEKDKMPGVSRAESELEADVARRQRQADKELKNIR